MGFKLTATIDKESDTLTSVPRHTHL